MLLSTVRNGKTGARFRPSFDTLRTNGNGRPFVVDLSPLVVSLSNHGHGHPDVPGKDILSPRGGTWLI